MRIPTEHFAHVPVVALSPSLMNSGSDEDSDGFPRSIGPRLLTPEPRNSVGSAPSSPRVNRRESASVPGSRVESRTGEGPRSLPAASPASTTERRYVHSSFVKSINYFLQNFKLNLSNIQLLEYCYVICCFCFTLRLM